ncbi:hypothetical protein BDW66DRAFT_146325 [Aspergillus desertorum]
MAAESNQEDGHVLNSLPPLPYETAQKAEPSSPLDHSKVTFLGQTASSLATTNEAGVLHARRGLVRTMGSYQVNEYYLRANEFPGVQLPFGLEEHVNPPVIEIDLGYNKRDLPCDDVTVFNLYGSFNTINLHLSIRPTDRRIHVAQFFNNKWHELRYINFRDFFVPNGDMSGSLSIRYRPEEGYSLQYCLDGTARGNRYLFNLRPLAPTTGMYYTTGGNGIWNDKLLLKLWH